MVRGIRGLFFSLFAIVVAVNIAGCRKGCVTCPEDTPATPGCSFNVTPLSQNFSYLGGGGSVAVVSTCSWGAASNANWIAITGVGSGSVQYNVQANSGPARTGTLSVAGQTVTITQDGAPSQPTPPPGPQPTPRPPQPTPEPTPQPTPTPQPVCTYAVQQTPQQFTYQGGNGGFSVSTSQSNCAWSASPNVGWIAITGGSPGTGNGSVNYIVAGNGGAARTGTISVAGKTVTVTQSAQ